MNSPEEIKRYYQQYIDQLQQKLQQLYGKRTWLGLLRFAIIALTAFAVYLVWTAGSFFIITILIIGIALFLIAVSKDTDNKNEINNLEILVRINQKEIAYLANNYHDCYDGKDLEPELHAYAADLDLFGKASLYQYANRCTADKSKSLLATRLLEPLSKQQILQQQEAIKELSNKPEWRQQLQAYGQKEKISQLTEERISRWLNTEDKHYNHSFWETFRYVYGFIGISTLCMYLFDFINTGFFSLMVFAFLCVSLVISKNITETYNLLSKIEIEISVLYNQLDWFEKEIFQAIFLKEVQEKIKHKNLKASAEILHLKKILNRFDVRLNVFAFIILNTFLLWDLHHLLALKKWKAQNKDLVPKWFAAIAEIEVASTFSTLAYNHPQWHFPEIADEHFILSGEEIGHPLIPEIQRVNNSFNIKGTAKIDLITGSNMAGKSTFLRSIGINMVLAFAGAPVCAKSFTVSIVKLLSSMRVTDNLAENTSTFYAELKKLKSIIDMVNRNEQVLILLDEILRGTNSLDRHTGSAALIKQLIHKNAVALIATHDVELAKLENDFPTNISNYHFDVQVAGEELFFDYKLKHGICTSLNASLLMKKIGIEL